MKQRNYNPHRIEKKWQKQWSETITHITPDHSLRANFYCLSMFPYPSSDGLHMGHCRVYTISDVIARYKKMKGFNVLQPMGFDAFGLPAENYALKTGIHPAKLTKKSIANIKRQVKFLGTMYDWQRQVNTSEPDYYKWTQWLFLQLYKNGLAYQTQAAVNWCPSCQTVLANEQVINGFCERCDSRVEKKYLKQWFFKITDYAERLLTDLDKIDWPEKIKVMQRNWIGKSEGADIDFKVDGSDEIIKVYTTRPDTLFGATFIVLSPEHPLVNKIVINNQRSEVKKYQEEAWKKSDLERMDLTKEKIGVFTGAYAINPVNNQKIPIWIADYVLMSYGYGAIMAVPAHDQRDFEFAKKYDLPIKVVIYNPNLITKEAIEDGRKLNNAYEGEGEIIRSGELTGMLTAEDKEKIVKWIENKKICNKAINYKLRDWLISRQRYWGAPIPIIYCQKCGPVPVPEKDLPVKLPEIKDFRPTGTGESPLAKSAKFVNAKCPQCRGRAKRETDTMDTFVCSSWYHYRYTDPKNKKEFATKEKIRNWLPVDLYIGGAEHAVMHLLYARFLAKFMLDQNLIDFDEPFSKFFSTGMIYYKGHKMSKSKGNVINPDDIIEQYGADVLRLYVLFMGPTDQDTEWSDYGIKGCYRFLEKLWSFADRFVAIKNMTKEKLPETKTQSLKNQLKKETHKTIRQITADIEKIHLNTMVSSLMKYLNTMTELRNLLPFEEAHRSWRKAISVCVLLIAPLAPYIAEEIWEKLGFKNSIFKQSWPSFIKSFTEEKMISIIVQVDGRLRDKLLVKSDINQEEIQKLATESDKVKKYIVDKKITKMIYVPKKLVNIVTAN